MAMQAESLSDGALLPNITSTDPLPPKTFLGSPGGEYAVRLMQPFSLSPHRVYVDEYEKLGDICPPKHAIKCERYIVPTNTTWAIEVTLKKGFNYDDKIGITVHVCNAATGIEIGRKHFEKDPYTTTLDSDKVYVVDNLDHAVVNGVRRDGVSLNFQELVDDDTLTNETDVPGTRPSELGGFIVRVEKRGSAYVRDANEKEFRWAMIRYEGRMKPLPGKVDGKSFNIDGITLAVGVLGGVEGKPLVIPQRKTRFCDSSDKVFFYYYCRSQAFMDNGDNGLFKKPIALDRYPWGSLKEHEQKLALKNLQTYDKDHTLKQKIAEAGPNADSKLIQRQLLELQDPVPHKWRPWGMLYLRERGTIYRQLQMRRKWFEKGTYPPDERLPGNSLKTALSLEEAEVKKEQEFDERLAPKLPLVANAKPRDFVSIPQKQPIVIDLDDSDEEISSSKLRGTKRPPPPAIPKKEPAVKLEPIDLSSYSPSPVPPADTRVAKRIKLETAEVEVPPQFTQEPPQMEENAELLRLKEEDERAEEEMRTLQRLAELQRKSNERKTRMAALGAKNRPLPTSRCSSRD